MIEREITRRDLLKLGRLAVFSGGIYAVTWWLDSLQNSSWAKKVTVCEGCRLAAVEVNGEKGLFIIKEENESFIPVYKVKGGIDLANAVYGLREVDEKGTPIPGKDEEFVILVVPDKEPNEAIRVIIVEDKAYSLTIPEGMKLREGLTVVFDDTVGLSKISDAQSGELIALYNPLTGQFVDGGENIFEKDQ